MKRHSRSLFSYVVRYDSGFAPNPFHGYCTLATCKPGVRKQARVGDWVVGTASGGAAVRRRGHLVYAMQVTEILTTAQYWSDPRFRCKRPDLCHNWVAASGDNIYAPTEHGGWQQLDSYHSEKDGRPNPNHVKRDTSVERVLVSDNYVYYGGEGPKLSKRFLSGEAMDLLRGPRNYQREREEEVIASFEEWLGSQGVRGYQGKPWDWVRRRRYRVSGQRGLVCEASGTRC